jgi:hypothetical protein
MENQIVISAEELEKELKRELEKTIHLWVDKTFNFIRVSVLEIYCDNSLQEYIRNKSVNEAFDSWLNDCDAELKIKEWLIEIQELNVELKISDFSNYLGSIKESFQVAFGDKWDEFVEWCSEQYEDDILEYIYEQENYPMWSTCFEFRDSFYNSEEDVQKCISVGLGVIEGLDDFNNLLFMTSAGHSFYSAYWIPLYLKLFPLEAEKYAGINYQDL